jgi:hypothetical protein
MLLWPAPRAGLFWTAGNPGALPFELDERYSAFRVALDGADGAYRRPLDPARASDVGLRAVAWAPVRARGAAVGRARVSRIDLRRPLSDYDAPYAGSPYVLMDTAASRLGHTEAALEGAAGWRLGRFGFGLALAYRAQHSRTEAAPVPRVLSAADPGASVGAVWRASARLRLGLHGRWRAHAERVLLYSVAASSRVYWLQGYFEARPQDIAAGFYQRRLERDGLAASLSAAGEAAGATWTAFVERGDQEERQHPPGDNDPASDIWTTDAWTVGAAVQRSLGARASAMLSGRYIALSGRARRGDLPDTVTFVADESVLDVGADIVIAPAGARGPQLAGRVVIRRENRARRDQIALLRSDLACWTTGFGVAVAYRPWPTFAVAAGGALARYGAGGVIPDPAGLGPAYRAYVAPELALQASDARATAATLSVLWAVLPAGSLWARASRSSLRGSSDVRLSLAPGGERAAWSLEMGIVLPP